MSWAVSVARLEHFADIEAASLRAASLTAQAAREAVASRRRFTVAFSGGSTPGRFFELLAEEAVAWEAAHVFWVDERLAPLDSPNSNYRLAWEHLLSRVPIPEANIHPMRTAERPVGNSGPMEHAGSKPVRTPSAGGRPDQETAAQAYEACLRRFFGGEAIPSFDVIHLGLGGDGHTASLFPGQPALEERERWVLPVRYAGASPPVARLTLTLPVINAARLVLFLVSGPDKAKLAEAAASGTCGGCPAGLVQPTGRLVWLLGG